MWLSVKPRQQNIIGFFARKMKKKHNFFSCFIDLMTLEALVLIFIENGKNYYFQLKYQRMVQEQYVEFYLKLLQNHIHELYHQVKQ